MERISRIGKRTLRSAGELGARHPVGAALGVLCVSWLVTFGLEPWSDDRRSAIGRLANFGTKVLEGQLPYADFAFEYPPLSAPVLGLAGLAGSGGEAFKVGLGIVTLAAYALLVVMVAALARRTGGDVRLAAMGVALTPLLLGAVVRLHVDPVPVALVAAALVCLVAGRDAAGLVLLAVGSLVKGFPLVAVPIALAWLAAERGWRASARAGAAFCAVLGAGVTVWFVLSPEYALASLTYHVERPIQIESTPASLLALVGALGGADPAAVQSHHSTGVTHPFADPLSFFFTAALAATVVVLAAMAAQATGAGGGAGGPRWLLSDTPHYLSSARGLVLAVATALTASAALGTVLSPQFLVWAVPLGALAFAWQMRGLATATAVACALTLLEFPDRYPRVRAGEASATLIVSVRNATLLLVVGLAIAELRRAGLGTDWAEWRTRIRLRRPRTPERAEA